MSVDILFRGSEELASDIMRSLVCGRWFAGAALWIMQVHFMLGGWAAHPPESHFDRHLEE